MSLEAVVEKIKSTYKSHEDFDNIVDNLSNNFCVERWAKRLCDDDFGNNKELSKELYKILLNEAEGEITNLASVAEQIANEDGLNDKEWAKAICNEIMNSPIDYYGGESLSGLLIALGDSKSAELVFQKALDAADDVDSLLDICKMYIHGKDEYRWENFTFLNLNDDEKAREFIEKAIKIASTSNELQQIAHIVGREADIQGTRGLNDKSWAKEIFKSSYEKENCFYDLKQLAELLIDDEIVDSSNTDDVNWIKEICTKGLDIGDADDKKDLKKLMKSRSIKLK